MSAGSEFEPVEAFSTFDDSGQPHEVQVWAEVTYSINDSGQKVRSVGLKHLRMADSGSVVHSHLDGSLEDSKTGLILRLGGRIENDDASSGNVSLGRDPLGGEALGSLRGIAGK